MASRFYPGAHPSTGFRLWAAILMRPLAATEFSELRIACYG
jgi:hypothetical protein